MAQSWRSGRGGGDARVARPLDESGLERAALRYVERYATTRAKLAAYLQRKVRERGWAGADPPAIEAIVERFAGLGYVDDAAFADARAASLTRRGYGPRRVAASLKAAGIRGEDGAAAQQIAVDKAWEAALLYARRRRLGPFGAPSDDPRVREKALASLIRAGHDFGIARQILDLDPADVPEWAKVNPS